MAPTNMKPQSRITKPKTGPAAQKKRNELRKKLMVVLKLPALKKQGQTSLFFTKLPAEIRLMIYEYALPSYDPIPDIDLFASFDPIPNNEWLEAYKYSVLKVCQAFRNESMKIYGQHLKTEIASTLAEYDELKRRARSNPPENGLDFIAQKLEEATKGRSLHYHLRNLNHKLHRLRGMGYSD